MSTVFISCECTPFRLFIIFVCLKISSKLLHAPLIIHYVTLEGLFMNVKSVLYPTL